MYLLPLCLVFDALLLMSQYRVYYMLVDGVPPDGIPLNVTTTIALPLTIVAQTFAIIGIIFAIFCLAFNIIFRNRK